MTLRPGGPTGSETPGQNLTPGETLCSVCAWEMAGENQVVKDKAQVKVSSVICVQINTKTFYNFNPQHLYF